MKRLHLALAASISIVSAGFGLTHSAHAVEWNAYTYAPAATLAGARGLQTITLSLIHISEPTRPY